MKLKEFIDKLNEIAEKEQLPFDLFELKLTQQGEIYPSDLINVQWDKEFTCFKLIFE